MIGIIVTGHGNFASGISSALELIGGKPDNYFYIDFKEGEAPIDITIKLKVAFDELKAAEGVIIFCDLAGGSPFKAAVEAASEIDRPIEVIAGANLPMIIETVTIREFVKNFQSLVAGAISTGKEQIVKFEYKDKAQDYQEDGI